MAVLSQDQIAAQMIAQLRVLDPSVSAEIGTPERKIIDTIAEAIAENQVDLNLTSGALDLSAKFGSDLDQFVGLFGFGRQQGAFATGFVSFGRTTPSSYDIIIPRGTQVQAINPNTVTFQTTAPVTLVNGQTSVAAPIQALVTGTQGNVAAGVIVQFANLGAPPLGITSVTNLIPTTNGADSETDAELKVRFTNTVFRNVAGTQDQYLALAIATQFSTMANVIGPVSRYQEYLQIPLIDDAAVGEDGTGNGLAGEYTTVPSSNPFAQHIYTSLPYFVSNGQLGTATIFYRQDTDFSLNAPPADAGDAHREALEGDIPSVASTPLNPNVTFTNVYTGTDGSVQLVRPNDVVLLEYSYLSDLSRNSISAGVTNCVDLFVNGSNPTTADAVIPPPSGTARVFVNAGDSPWYYKNFIRVGQPYTNPTLGHILQGLFWQPLLDLPSSILVGTTTFFKGTHYWAVQDVSLIGGTVRSRDGIEWDPTLNGKALADPVAGPYTGPKITATGASDITITGYIYDKNIVDLQTALEGVKQVTTDVLAHRATVRYFKFDLTVIYQPGTAGVTTNTAIASAITTLLANQYFGATIQLADILTTVRQVAGVLNVRWSNDVINPSDDSTNLLNRVTETDINGNPTPTPTANTFNTDFYLHEDELPTLPTGQISGDTLPGLIIRPRARNTFTVV